MLNCKWTLLTGRLDASSWFFFVGRGNAGDNRHPLEIFLTWKMASCIRECSEDPTLYWEIINFHRWCFKLFTACHFPRRFYHMDNFGSLIETILILLWEILVYGMKTAYHQISHVNEDFECLYEHPRKVFTTLNFIWRGKIFGAWSPCWIYYPSLGSSMDLHKGC